LRQPIDFAIDGFECDRVVVCWFYIHVLDLFWLSAVRV